MIISFIYITDTVTNCSRGNTKPIPPMGELIEFLVPELVTSVFLSKHSSNNISSCFSRYSISILHLSPYQVVIFLIEKLACVFVLNMLIVKGLSLIIIFHLGCASFLKK